MLFENGLRLVVNVYCKIQGNTTDMLKRGEKMESYKMLNQNQRRPKKKRRKIQNKYNK